MLLNLVNKEKSEVMSCECLLAISIGNIYLISVGLWKQQCVTAIFFSSLN